MSTKILEMKGISKSFPGVKALDNVNLNIYQGKVMAVLGENGAGKSTLMKILSGVYQRSSGEILFGGKPVEFQNTRDSQDCGIAIIHQELNLIPELSIGENIFLGREPLTKFNLIDWKKLYKDTEELLKLLSVEEDPRVTVAGLSIGKKQMIEIAKALSINAEIIIMDEPTDALTDKETESLFKIVNLLRQQGKSVVYISHRLKEIFEICDHVTVLRDGRFVDEKLVSEINEDLLIEMMVGRKLTEQYPKQTIDLGDTVLEVKNLTNRFVKDISFDLKKGEVLGIAGLMGAGRTELVKTIYGAIKLDSGEIYIDGKLIVNKSEGDAVSHKITYVSEDRKKDGLVLGMSVKENISLSALVNFAKNGIINKAKEEEEAKNYIKKMSIKTPSMNQLVRNLSGGNQQKVSIAKSLMNDPKVLILDEPTRGVDVGAKKEIYELINTFKSQGMSMIVVSSEILEILGICDRILVMHEGRVSGILDVKEATQENIMRLAVGIKEEK